MAAAFRASAGGFHFPVRRRQRRQAHQPQGDAGPLRRASPLLRRPRVSLPGRFDRQGAFRLSGWACVLVVFAAHFIEDHGGCSRFSPPGARQHPVFLWDQVIHYAVIFAVVPAGLSSVSDLELMPEKWPVLGCLAVLVTHGPPCSFISSKRPLGPPFPGAQRNTSGSPSGWSGAVLLLPNPWWAPPPRSGVSSCIGSAPSAWSIFLGSAWRPARPFP